MSRELRKIYFKILIPSVLGLFGIFLVKLFGFFTFGHFKAMQILAPVTFVLSVIFAAALPIFLRTLFAHHMRFQKYTSARDLIKFERNLIFSALVAPYLIIPAYLFEFPRFYLAGTVLMALYAAYYYYPSERRIRFEKRVFRVK